MAESIRFRILKRRLAELRHRMLPKDFSPTGAYTELQLDRTRGYRLLVHAEIEAFLEDRATEIVKGAFDLWRVDNKPRHTIISLVCYCRVTDRVFESVSLSVGDAFGLFSRIIKKNHGVKEENVLQFLLPAGIDRADLDETWLSTLSSFGTARGEVAHSSARTHQPIDPLGEYDTVTKRILPGLKVLDQLLQNLSC